MTHSMKRWKDAASLIIAARRPNRVNEGARQAESCDYQILMMKRQRKSTAFAGKHVFPGGITEPSDFSQKWVNIFKHVGVTCAGDFRLPDLRGKPRPWPVAVERSPESLPSDVAFRICSVRETFEESGILLLTNQVKGSSSPDDPPNSASCFHGDMNEQDLRTWQKRVHQDGSTFMDLCSELRAVPDIWALKEWYHVLTPQWMKKRYDTMFYLCAMENIPKVNIDDVEMIQTMWGSPHKILMQFAEGRITLDPPQITIMLMLLKLPGLDELGGFTSRREFLGLTSTMPVLYSCKDGTIGTLPGDDLYPREPSLDYNPSLRELDETMEEAMVRCQNLCRLRYPNEDVSLDCTIDLECGLPSPVSFSQSGWNSGTPV